jgi:hypothetical protein
MPDIRYVDKRANDKFDIEIAFINADPAIVYSITGSPVVSATDDAGVDVTASLIDGSLTAASGSKATIWVRNGTAGKIYTVLVKVTMTTGQVFEQMIVLKILK